MTIGASRSLAVVLVVLVGASPVSPGRAQHGASMREGAPLEERAIEPLPSATPWACHYPAPPIEERALTRAIDAMLPALLSCYGTSTSGRLGYSGRIGVSFEIVPEGRARDVRVELDTVGLPPLAQCVVAAFARAALPRYRGAGSAWRHRLSVVFVER